MITAIAPDLHAVESEIRFPGGFTMPLRMTVVRLSEGGLVLISPVALDDATAAEVAALGPVRHIVAPNLRQHLHAASARARFPDARLLGAPGLAAHRKDLVFDGELGTAPAPWGDELAVSLLGGVPRMSELVFLHRPSRTLVVTDLVFHVTEAKNAITRAMLRLSGSHAGDGAGLWRSRLWRVLVSDRAAHEASLDRVLALDFDRLVMAHGRVVDAGAKARLAAALGRAPG